MIAFRSIVSTLGYRILVDKMEESDGVQYQSYRLEKIGMWMDKHCVLRIYKNVTIKRVVVVNKNLFSKWVIECYEKLKKRACLGRL